MSSARNRKLSPPRNLKHSRKLSEFSVKPSRKKMPGWLKRNVLLMKQQSARKTLSTVAPLTARQ